MKNIYALFFLIACSLSPALYAQTTLVIPASQDNTIYNNLPGNSNGAGENFTVGTIQGGAIRRGLIRFDLSAIPAGAVITAVNLQLYMNRSIVGVIDISLYRLNQAWGEGASLALGDGFPADGNGVPAQAGDVTWPCSFADGAGGCTTLWSTTGGAFVSTASATTAVLNAGAYAWSSSQLIADVQGWVNNNSSNYGWIVRGDEVIFPGAKRFASRTNAVVANRPALSVTYTTVVPVSLVYFKASAQKYGSLLRWQTAQETDNDFFEIEHSLDGVYFNAVAKIKGAGNSNLPLKYQYIHQPPMGSKHFYRISQTDFNGRKSFSKIAMVIFFHPNNQLLISPNPVNDRLLVSGLDIDGTEQYALFNYTGHKIAGAILLNKVIILPKKMPAGIYYLRIMGSDGTMRSAAFIK